MTIRGVTLDVDGTLYASRSVAWPVFKRAWRKLRVLRVGRRVREELRGHRFDSGQAMLAEEARIAAERLECTPAEARARIDDVFDRVLCEALRQKGAPPSVRPALERAAAAGIALAAISDRRVDDKLRALGLAGLPWCAKLCADDTGILKPDPRPFVTACECMGVAPAEAVHLGDRDDTDGDGARAAGMRFILVDGPAHVVAALDEMARNSP